MAQSIYISGPISAQVPGVTRSELKQRFYSVQDFLKRNHGYLFPVVNPCEIPNPCDRSCFNPQVRKPPQTEAGDHTWECWLRKDIVELVKCDAILMLPAWQQSRGALLENKIARELNFAIYYIEMHDGPLGWRLA